MDPTKRTTLIEWVNSVESEIQIKSLFDLKDGKRLIDLLKLLDHFECKDFKETKERIQFIRTFLEGFFKVNFVESKLINFDLILTSAEEENDLIEFELAKILLAVLGLAVQDPNCQSFVVPAMSLSETIQLNIKDILEAMLSSSATDSALSHDFADILTKTTANTGNSQSHRDTTLFFRLVANAFPTTPLVDQSFNYSVGDFKQSPNYARVSNTSIGSIRDISSPLRMLTLTSSPIGEFMQSPHLTQKILLREKELRNRQEVLLRAKDQEMKKLELALKNEAHLRQELELDLQEKAAEIDKKESKNKDLQKQLQEMRKLRDNLDELDALRSDNDHLQKEMERYKGKLEQMSDLRSQCSYQDIEMKSLMEENKKFKNELRTLEVIKAGNEDYRVRNHRLSLRVDELEKQVAQRDEVVCNMEAEHQTLQQHLEQCRQVIACQRNELEEVLAAPSIGESMSVVADKRILDLEAELLRLEERTVSKDCHNATLSQMEEIASTRDAFEQNYLTARSNLLAAEDQIKELQCHLEKSESHVCQLTESRRDLQTQIRDQAETLAQTQAEVQKLSTLRDSNQEKMTGQETDLNKCRTDLTLVKTEVRARTEECSRLQETLARHRNKEAGLKAKVSCRDAQYQDLLHQHELELALPQRQVKVLEQKVCNLSSRNSELATQHKHALEEKTEELKRSMSELEEEKVKVVRDLESLISEKAEEVDNLSQKLSEETSAYEEFRATSADKVEKLQLEKKELQEKGERFVEEHRQLVEEKDVILSEVMKQLEESKVRLSEREAEVACLVSQVSSLTEQVQQQWSMLEEKNGVISQLTSKVEILTNDIHNCNGVLVEKESKITEISQVVESLSVTVRTQESVIAETETMLSETRTQLQVLVGEIEQHRQTLAEKESSIASLTQRVENMTSDSDELSRGLAEKTGSLEQLTTSVRNLEQSLSVAEQQVSALSEEVQACRGDLNEKEEEVCQLRTDLESRKLERQIGEDNYQEELKHVEGEKSDLLLQLTSSRESHEEMVRELKEELKASKESQELVVDDLKQELRHREEERDATRQEADVRAQDLLKQLEDVASLKDGETRDFLQKQLELQRDLSEYRTRTEDLKDKLKKEVEGYVQREKDMQACISRLEASVDEVTSHREAEHSASTVREEGLYAQITMLEGSVGSLEGQLKQVSAEHASQEKEMMEQLQQLRREVETESDTMSAMSSEIQTLNQCLRAKEAAVEELEKKLEEELQNASRDQTSSTETHRAEVQQREVLCESLKQQMSYREKTIEALEVNLAEKQKLIESMRVEHEETVAGLKADKEEELSLLQNTFEGKIAVLSSSHGVGDKKLKKSFQEEKAMLIANHEAQISAATQAVMATKENVELFRERQAQYEDSIKELREQQTASAEESRTKLADTDNYWTLQLSTLQEEFDDAMIEGKAFDEQQLNEAQTKHEDDTVVLMEKHEGQLVSQKAVFEEIIDNLKASLDRQKADFAEKLEQAEEERGRTVGALEEDHKTKLSHLQSCLKEMAHSQKEMKLSLEENQEKTKHIETCLTIRNRDLEEKMVQEQVAKEDAVAEVRREYEVQLARAAEEQAKLEKLLEATGTELEVQVQQLQAQLARQEEKLQLEVQQLKEDAQREKGEVESREAKLKEEVARLEAEKSGMEVEATGLRARLEEASALVQRAQNEKVGSERAAARYKEDLEAAETEIAVQLESERRVYEEQMSCLKAEIHGLKAEYSTTRESLKQSNSETVARYEAEMMSLKQQLAAVEEEKLLAERENEALLAQHERRLTSSRRQTNTDFLAIRIERDRLQTQVDIMQEKKELTTSKMADLAQEINRYTSRCEQFETECHEMDQRLSELTERERSLKSDLEKQRAYKSKIEDRCKELVQKLQTHLEREQKMVREHGRELSMASDLNAKLQTQVERGNMKLEDLARKTEKVEAERKKLAEKVRTYQETYAKHKDSMETMATALQTQRHTADKHRQRAERMESEVTRMHEDNVTTKSLAMKVRTLETQLQLADSQVREYRHQLDQAGTALLGDTNAFQRHMELHADEGVSIDLPGVSSTGETESSADDSLELGNKTMQPPNLRSQTSEKTLTNQDVDSTPAQYSPKMSLRSRSRESLRSTTSRESLRSTTSSGSAFELPQGTGNFFSCEDEPALDFEWTRLSELKRRNTLCLPHMKSSYAIETQHVVGQTKPGDVIPSMAAPGDVIPSLAARMSDVGLTSKKRKPDDMMEVDEGPSKTLQPDQRKHPRFGTVYQRPGPPTPANGHAMKRRSSGRLNQTPRSAPKSPRSPKTPTSARGKSRSNSRTPRGTRRRTPKGMSPRTGSSPRWGNENKAPAKLSDRRESIAFSIGFSPIQSTGPRRMKRQTGFIQKQPEEKRSQVNRLINMFEHGVESLIKTPLKKVSKRMIRMRTPKSLFPHNKPQRQKQYGDKKTSGK